eukprot:NODE_160_length_1955_cov_276.422875_g119_i0.p1 GENE.NODE_160_length_1955_cov_276.422875_g119_i0~~NODE_160_length_1955_cov_276.422875_g119_i0.p1  ORF type:complete len:603 (+),score=125.19 NODE_160_length_1955_cov_276.422875_g119_i0:25-1809(+)
MGSEDTMFAPPSAEEAETTMFGLAEQASRMSGDVPHAQSGISGDEGSLASLTTQSLAVPPEAQVSDSEKMATLDAEHQLFVAALADCESAALQLKEAWLQQSAAQIRLSATNECLARATEIKVAMLRQLGVSTSDELSSLLTAKRTDMDASCAQLESRLAAEWHAAEAGHLAELQEVDKQFHLIQQALSAEHQSALAGLDAHLSHLAKEHECLLAAQNAEVQQLVRQHVERIAELSARRAELRAKLEGSQATRLQISEEHQQAGQHLTAALTGLQHRLASLQAAESQSPASTPSLMAPAMDCQAGQLAWKRSYILQDKAHQETEAAAQSTRLAAETDGVRRQLSAVHKDSQVSLDGLIKQVAQFEAELASVHAAKALLSSSNPPTLHLEREALAQRLHEAEHLLDSHLKQAQQKVNDLECGPHGQLEHLDGLIANASTALTAAQQGKNDPKESGWECLDPTVLEPALCRLRTDLATREASTRPKIDAVQREMETVPDLRGEIGALEKERSALLERIATASLQISKLTEQASHLSSASAMVAEMPAVAEEAAPAKPRRVFADLTNAVALPKGKSKRQVEDNHVAPKRARRAVVAL